MWELWHIFLWFCSFTINLYMRNSISKVSAEELTFIKCILLLERCQGESEQVIHNDSGMWSCKTDFLHVDLPEFLPCSGFRIHFSQNNFPHIVFVTWKLLHYTPTKYIVINFNLWIFSFSMHILLFSVYILSWGVSLRRHICNL